MEEFFRGNSRITSDCPVCSMLKTLSGCSMLAEIVRNSFTGRGDLSETAVLRSSTLVKSYTSSDERMISFEGPRRIMINSLAKTTLSLTTTRQITFHIICLNFQVVLFENSSREFGTLNAVCEEIIKLHIFFESRQENF